VLASDSGKKIPVSIKHQNNPSSNHDNIQVGRSPWGLAVNPITDRLYVANLASNDVSVIDYGFGLNNLTVFNMTKVPVGVNPLGVAVDDNSNRVYVTNLISNSISVIDGLTNKVINNITGVLGPSAIDIDQNNKKLFVVSEFYRTVYVIDTSIPKIEKTFYVGGHPRYVFFNEKNKIAYVSNEGSNSINMISDRNNNNTLLMGVRFKVSFPDAANIQCANEDLNLNSTNNSYSNNDYGLFANNTILKCHAVPKNGFNFISWSCLEHSNKQHAAFNVLHFGTLTANVEAVPSEDFLQKHYDLVFTLVAAAILGPIVGWMLPWIAAIREKKRQLQYLRTVIPLVEDICKENRQNKQNCLNLLEQQKKETIALLQGGIITEATYRILNSLITGHIVEVSK
jgi:YVTN family beta-propeller protein